jgi:hypothetical protein
MALRNSIYFKRAELLLYLYEIIEYLRSTDREANIVIERYIE